MLRSFSNVINDLRGGQLDDEATQALASLVRHCVRVGLPGGLTLALAIVPKNGTVTVRGKISIKSPTSELPEAHFFALPDGSLVSEGMIAPAKSDGETTAGEDEPDVEHDPETGEVIEPDAAAPSAADDAALYRQAVAVVIGDGKASVANVQRQLQLGYNRAAQMLERMTVDGIVGPVDHAGKREVLGTAADFERLFGEGLPQ